MLLPAFINCHVHLELEWIRDSIGDFSDFTGWLEYIMQARINMTDYDAVSSSVKNGISSLLDCGVSTVGEISSYGSIDSDILKSSPLRTILFREIVDSNDTALLETDFGALSDLFEIRPFPHAPYSCSPALISRSAKKAISSNVPFAIHLAESREEVQFVKKLPNNIESYIYKIIGKHPFPRESAHSPLEYLSVFLEPGRSRMTAIHMVQVNPEELNTIREFDIGIVSCPRSNHYLGVGEPPLGMYSEIDRIGIGTDGLSSNYDLDFFKELRCFDSIAKKYMGERSPEFTVYAATLGGARALFIDERTGSIEAGKSADLLFLKTHASNGDPYADILNSTPDEIGFFMISGEVLKSN